MTTYTHKCKMCDTELFTVVGKVYDYPEKYILICKKCLEKLGIKLCCGIPMIQYSSYGSDTYKCTKCGKVIIDD